jgi:hypothetical protein
MSETQQERLGIVTRWLSGDYMADREIREAIRALLAENALHKRWHRKPTHGACCTCQKCGQDYDTCRCSLDDVADDLEKAEAERDALKARVEAVLALHVEDRGVCRECSGAGGVFWPCPTIRALEEK